MDDYKRGIIDSLTTGIKEENHSSYYLKGFEFGSKYLKKDIEVPPKVIKTKYISFLKEQIK